MPTINGEAVEFHGPVVMGGEFLDCRESGGGAKAVEGEWIDVKERLPDWDVSVLADCGGRLFLLLRSLADEDGGWYWSGCTVSVGTDLRQPDEAEGDDYEPTHWMPLPSPPLNVQP